MANQFKLLRNTSLLATLLWGALAPVAFSFTDTQTHWGETCINQLSQRKLVSGYPDNTFKPNSTINRAEFAVLMLNMFPDAEVKRQAINFRDVPTTHWAYQAIRKAYEREFFTGYPDAIFQPSQPIPRVQALAILANSLNYSVPEQPDDVLRLYFDDAAQIPAYAKNAIASAAVGRIAVNYPNIKQLKPNQSSTRGEVATFLCQSLNLARTVPLQYVAKGTQSFAIPPEMGGFGEFHENLALASIHGKVGYINPAGEIVIQPQFISAANFSEGLAAVQVGERWGYIDKTGKVVIQPQFNEAMDFSEGLAKVKLGDKVSFIDKTGKQAFELQYPDAQYFDVVEPFSDGLALIRIDFQKSGFIDKTGKFVIEPQPIVVYSSFSEGLARIYKDGKYGYIDKTGKMVIEPQFKQAQDFSEGLAAVSLDDSKWGYIDKAGNLVIQPQFYGVQKFSEGLAGAKKGDSWGFIDKTGNFAIAEQFKSPAYYYGSGVAPFSEGLAMVRLGEKAGFIDKTGKFVIAPQFMNATSFVNGFARVNVAGKWITTVSTGGNNPPESFSSLVGGKWGYIRNPQANQ